MATRLVPLKERWEVRETPFGVEYIDVFAGPMDSATARTLAPDRGTLRGSLGGQESASGAVGPRVQNVQVHPDKSGQGTIVIVRYLEIASA